MLEKIFAGVGGALVLVMLAAVSSLLMGGALSLGTLWLSGAVTSFDVPALGYWESVAIWLVASVVFGNYRLGSSS